MQRTGARSTAQLLDVAAALLSLQKPSAAILHAEAVFQFLLPALDVRQSCAAAFTPEGEALLSQLHWSTPSAHQQNVAICHNRVGCHGRAAMLSRCC
jgi:hypothetical protein